MIIIRDAGPDDSEAIRILAQQLGYEVSAEEVATRLERMSVSGGHAVLVAELPGCGVVGWIHVLLHTLLMSGTGAEIGGLIVDKEHRGGRIGQALVQAAERWARSRGLPGIVVRSNAQRQGAHEFYPRVGYDFVKTQHVYRKVLDP